MRNVRRWSIALVLIAFVALVLTLRNPVLGTQQRLILILGWVGIWCGLLASLWRFRWVRYGLVAIPLLLISLLSLPGREIDEDELRSDYVRRMAAFEGISYFWGGEGWRGIDCSGLPRRAYRDALLAYGLRHLDGGAVRMSVEQWWFDTSARALGEGYRGFTNPLEVSGSIVEMDYSELKAGDLAVTRGGLHTLAYVGEGNWIQADPGIGKVATLNGKMDKNGWFKNRVEMHRWRVFDEN